MTLKPTQITAIKKILDPWLEYQQIHNRWPSLSIGLILNGQIELTKSWGHADIEKEVYATPSTHYRIASISKSFTTVMILKLVDKGECQLDDYIDQYVELSPSVRQKITIRDIMIHASGLSRDGVTSHWSHGQFPDDEALFSELKHTSLITDSLEEWRYSNFGFAILGMIIENITGTSYQHAINTHILKPLKLEHTAVDLLPSCLDHSATPYARDVPGKPRQSLEHLKTLSYAPATGFCTTTKDLTSWIVSLMKNHLQLSDHSLHELFRIQWHHPPSDTNRALGFSINYTNKHKIINHGGNFQGFSSRIEFAPDEHYGIALLTNAISEDPSDVLQSIINIINYIANHPPKKTGKHGSLSKYEGTYENVWGVGEVVSLGDRLMIVWLSDKHPAKTSTILTPISKERFKITKADPYGSVSQEAYFTKNPKGQSQLYLGSTYFIKHA